MPGGIKKPGEGDRRCNGIEGQGGRCGNWEIEGLEYCLLHMPDEYVEEAEDITGMHRCREGFGEPGGCYQYAVEGSVPFRCALHGQAHGSLNRLRSTTRVVEGNVADRLAQIMTEGGEKLLNPPGISDPLSELLDLAAEMKALKELMREYTAHIASRGQLRYAHSKAGEQLRMEVILYERALERYAKILIDISKLKIEDRLMGVREATAAMLERALDAALEDSGVGIEGKHTARETFRKHLKVVA